MAEVLACLLLGVTETSRHVRWPNAPAPWIVALLIAVLAGYAGSLYLSETKRVAGRTRGLLALLRAAVLLLVLAILFGPILATEEIEVREGTVAVLVDTSLSMAFKDKFVDRGEVSRLVRATGVPGDQVEETSRLDLVRAALMRRDGAFYTRLAKRNRVRLYTFDDRARGVGELPKGMSFDGEDEEAAAFRGAVDALQPLGQTTAFGDALRQVARDLRGRPIAGIVAITDGRSNTGVLDPRRVAVDLGGREIPVHAVGVGNPEEPRDIVLGNLQASEVVLVGDMVPFDFTVRHRGFEGERVRVDLRLNDRVVRSEEVVLAAPDTLQPVRIPLKTTIAGDYTCTVEAEVRAGELLKENNVLSHRLRVVDERLRVLYVDGYPRYEYRFLKTALLRDKTMQVQCLLLSSDPEFPQETTPGVVPLAGFPETREALFDYHVLILGDVNVKDTAWFRGEQLEWIRDFVGEMGGGFLSIAGEIDAPACFVGTPIESLLPVVLPEPRDAPRHRVPVYTVPFRPVLTPDGGEDPITRLLDDPERNRELWEDANGVDDDSLPGLYWYFAAKKAKPAARVLAAHPAGSPLIAIQYYKAGRCLSSALDETWRWRAGVGDRYFYRFWGQAVRFLATGRLLGQTRRHTLATDKSRYAIGETVTISARILDPDFKPVVQERQTVYIQAPEGPVEALDLAGKPNQPGRFDGVVTARYVGSYKVWIGTRDEGDEKMAYRTFEVEVPPLEYSDPRLDADTLRVVAAESGGRVYGLEDLEALVEAVQPVTERSRSAVSEDEVWDRPLWIWVFLGLLAVEWLIRRWRRLP